MTNLVRSFQQEILYEQQTNHRTVYGTLRLRRADGQFLHARDSYTITDVYRIVDSLGIKRYLANETLPQTVIVSDVTPPVPAGLDQETIEEWERTVTGTWTLAHAYDNGPSSLSAKLSTGAGIFTDLAGTGTIDSGGTWSFTIANTQTLHEGDVIAIILIDDQGNENPLVDTAYRDALFPAASRILVTEASSLPYSVHYHLDGIEDVGLLHIGYVTMPGGFVDHGIDFPDKAPPGFLLDSSNPTLPAYIDTTHDILRIYYVTDPRLVPSGVTVGKTYAYGAFLAAATFSSVVIHGKCKRSYRTNHRSRKEREVS
jgi:hypothetical protein